MIRNVRLHTVNQFFLNFKSSLKMLFTLRSELEIFETSEIFRFCYTLVYLFKYLISSNISSLVLDVLEEGHVLPEFYKDEVSECIPKSNIF